MPQDVTNSQNENNRQAQETLFGEPEDKNDRVQLSSRYEQYAFAKRHLGGIPERKVFPLGEDGAKDNGLSGHIANTLTARYEPAQATGTYVGEGKLNAQIIRIPEATKQGYAEAKVGDSINLSVPNSKTRRGRIGGGIAQTIDTGMQQHTLTQDMKIRRLTPRECERLMGYPDFWTTWGNKNGARIKISDTQRYKTLGNGLVSNVAQEIVKALLTPQEH